VDLQSGLYAGTGVYPVPVILQAGQIPMEFGIWLFVIAYIFGLTYLVLKHVSMTDKRLHIMEREIAADRQAMTQAMLKFMQSVDDKMRGIPD
jgi:hypothetical protein